MRRIWAWIKYKLWFYHQRYKAFRRGERMIKGTKELRGRIWEKRNPGNEDGSPSNITARSRPVASISARVFRAETGEYEDLGVISKGEVKER